MKNIIVLLILVLFATACRSQSETAEAQLELGRKYCDEKVPEKDYKKGMEYLLKSAKRGNAEAMYYVGHAYLSGRYCGATEDESQAVKWFHQAAELGDVSSMFKLSDLYYIGAAGVPKNKEESDKWRVKAYSIEKDIPLDGSPGLIRLKENLLIGNDKAGEIILNDKSKDITPWLKEDIHKFSPVYMFMFLQRLIGEAAPLNDILFWYMAARYRVAAYVAICQTSPSGEQALFSSLIAVSRDRINYAYKNDPQWEEFNKESARRKIAKSVFEWDKNNEIDYYFCKRQDISTKQEWEEKLAEFKRKYFKNIR